MMVDFYIIGYTCVIKTCRYSIRELLMLKLLQYIVLKSASLKHQSADAAVTRKNNFVLQLKGKEGKYVVMFLWSNVPDFV